MKFNIVVLGAVLLMGSAAYGEIDTVPTRPPLSGEEEIKKKPAVSMEGWDTLIFGMPHGGPVTSGWKSPVSVRFRGVPQVKGHYLRPVIGGYKSQGIHDKNGVDLAHYCGEPVLAASGGMVERVYSSGWNGGYGQYVRIAHPNGTVTLYAHLSRTYVTPGQYVSCGHRIGLVGTTGNSTGCHLHFEVRGSKNPF